MPQAEGGAEDDQADPTAAEPLLEAAQDECPLQLLADPARHDGHDKQNQSITGRADKRFDGVYRHVADPWPEGVQRPQRGRRQHDGHGHEHESQSRLPELRPRAEEGRVRLFTMAP